MLSPERLGPDYICHLSLTTSQSRETDSNPYIYNETAFNDFEVIRTHFEEVKALWKDPYLLEAEARTTDEPRFLVIGKIGDKHWSTVITYRKDKVRIISARRSQKEEIELYEKS